MENVVIVSSVRTPVASFQGGFGSVPAPKLGAAAIKEAISRAGVSADQIDEVIMGEVRHLLLGPHP
jgi:acetyl-CoA C-acetyltransferase